MREKYGPLPDETFVIRGTLIRKRIDTIRRLDDVELSENATERAEQREELKRDRWLALFEVRVDRWLEGQGTHGDAPPKIVLIRGVSFDDKGAPARGMIVSGDWDDRREYDRLDTGREYEFHVVTESLYGPYYGLVYAYPVIGGVVQQEDAMTGFRGRDYRFEDARRSG